MKTWIEPQAVKIPPDLQASVGGHPLVAEILIRRGFTDLQTISAFLDPDCYQPASAYALPGMSQAVERLEGALQRGETICVWGDFDVDGQTATTVLVSVLRELGGHITYHIPVRASESHGVNLPVLERLIQEGVNLVLTCDTGIAAHEAVEYARSQGVDVIITDHHDPPPTLPDAYALVNPKLLPSSPDSAAHPLASLPGVGVAYQLAKALYERTGSAGEIERYLDLVALGIVADLALLTADTRYLLQIGLQVLRNTERPGLQAMTSFAGIDPAHLSEEHIAFGLAPRMNALGRLADANLAVDFLTTKDVGKARIQAERLEQLNAQRKLQTDQVYQAAQSQIEGERSLLEHAALVLAHPAWPAGVIGIVASRLVERYNRPVVLISSPQAQLARGSARSVAGCNITAAIAAQQDLLGNYGGHPMAAGLAIDPENIPAFRRALSRTVADMLGAVNIEPELEIDSYLPLAALTPELVADLERLAPFGPGNSALTLVCKDVTLKKHTPIGRSGEHLQLVVADPESETYKVVWWGGAGAPLPAGRFDMAYLARTSDYLGQPGVQVEWVDARPIGEPIEIKPGKPKLPVIDYRHVDHRLAVLKGLVAQEGVQVWAEAEAREKLAAQDIPSEDRQGLALSKAVAIWTTPPGRSELDVVLERLSPERVYVFGVDPETGDIEFFLSRLAGLVKHALSARNGLVRLEDLAAAAAHTKSTVHAGVIWLRAQGHVEILADDSVVLKLAAGNGESRDKRNQPTRRLKAVLKETAAYRAHFARADADTLINPPED